jgi:hypothetical protein
VDIDLDLRDGIARFRPVEEKYMSDESEETGLQSLQLTLHSQK